MRVIASIAVLCVGLSVLLSPLSAKQATQGVAGATVGGTVFTSPMILDTVLVATDRSIWGKRGWFVADEYRELSKFTCDGVRLAGHEPQGLFRGDWKSGLEIAVKKTKAQDVVEVRVRLTFQNPEHNHDKAVTVVLELRDGANTAHAVNVGPFQVEEGKSGRGEGAFLVPVDLLLKEPPPALRLTIITRDSFLATPSARPRQSAWCPS